MSEELPWVALTGRVGVFGVLSSEQLIAVADRAVVRAETDGRWPTAAATARKKLTALREMSPTASADYAVEVRRASMQILWHASNAHLVFEDARVVGSDAYWQARNRLFDDALAVLGVPEDVRAVYLRLADHWSGTHEELLAVCVAAVAP